MYSLSAHAVPGRKQGEIVDKNISVKFYIGLHDGTDYIHSTSLEATKQRMIWRSGGTTDQATRNGMTKKIRTKEREGMAAWPDKEDLDQGTRRHCARA